MNKEEEYKITLIHVIKWLGGENEFDSFRPVSADYANRIVQIMRYVVQGKTLQEAINLVK